MRRLGVLAVIGIALLWALASVLVYANKPDETGKHDHPKDTDEALHIETTNFEFTPRNFVGDGSQTVEVRLVQGNWHNVTVCHPDAEIVNGVCDLEEEDPAYPPLLSMDFENKRPIIVDFEAPEFAGFADDQTFNYFCRFHISRDMKGTIRQAPE